MAANTLLSDSFWKVCAQWGLIIVGLFVVARAIAAAVGPGVKWEYRPAQWRILAWTGMVLLAASSVPWTVFSVHGDTGSAADGAGLAMLITVVVAFALLAAFLLLPDRLMSVPLPALFWAVLMGLDAAAVSAFVVGIGKHAFAPIPAYVATGTVSAVGVVMFGLGLGTRMRMRIVVRDEKGQESSVDTAYVAGRMSAMSHKPRGLETPQGTDVLTLPSEAVAALPSEGRMAVSLLRFGLTLFSIAPWRADVVLVDDATATVDLRRNSVDAESTIVYRSELGLSGFDLPDQKPCTSYLPSHDVLTGAAAFLLVRMSETHTNLGEGLCGARHWRGLACQILAGTPPWDKDPEARKRLYATAVDKDPHNDAAWVGYLWARESEPSATGESGERYVRRLSTLYKKILPKVVQDGDDGYLPLAMRVARSLVYVHRNLAQGQEDGTRKNQHAARANALAAQLQRMTEYATASPDRDLQLFGEFMEPSARILARDKPCGCRGPRDNYDHACMLAYDGREHYPDALDCLELAADLPELRDAARTDPSFKELRNDEEYRERFADVTGQPRALDRAEQALRTTADDINRLASAVSHRNPRFLKRNHAHANADGERRGHRSGKGHR
ncbi:hypothetical protein [Streptomyces sp. HPF1205]|uniref:hypothetical protein n=1 Tax=Streptomyces sp. HPF1205 TaxID=2873262 RepID=UPI001CEC6A7F|nr:hypothetical protein [Streptomyces sp. HPF1205]